jgi:hypothetical protein
MAAFPATAGLVEMDPANDTLEVFFETYTGGAHCCAELRILTRSASGKWKTLEAGAFNGGGGLVDDLEGDGRYEMASSPAGWRRRSSSAKARPRGPTC